MSRHAEKAVIDFVNEHRGQSTSFRTDIDLGLTISIHDRLINFEL